MTSVEQAFAGRPDSIAKARAWARDYYSAHGAAREAVEDAVLVLSELAANAVTHTRSGGPHGCFLVLLRHTPTRLRVEVTDAGGRTIPRPRPAPDPEDYAAHGRGLALVGALTERWHVHGDHRSWTVAADIPCPTPDDLDEVQP